MHGFSSTSVLLVNAEIYSMGGAVEAGVGTANRTSPRKAAIQKVQDELRQEYDIREERKRELEFLENGGNPLDFKLGDPLSVSVQSTSYPDQHPASEAKGSLALTGSTHGDSVESSGDQNPLKPRNNIAPSEISSQIDGSHKAVELRDSAAFGIPRKAYKRRNRSRPSRDGARPNSADVKGLVIEDLQRDMKLDAEKAVQSTGELNDAPSVDTNASQNLIDEIPNQHHLSGDPNALIQLDSNGPEAVQKMEEMGSAVSLIQQGLTASKPDEQAMPVQMNGSISKKGDESDTEMCTKEDNAESNVNTMDEAIAPEKRGVIEGGEGGEDKKETEGGEIVEDKKETEGGEIVEDKKETEGGEIAEDKKETEGGEIVEDRKEIEGGEVVEDKIEIEYTSSVSPLKTGVEDHDAPEGMKDCGPTGSEPEPDKVHPDLLALNPAPKNDDCCNDMNQNVRDVTVLDVKDAGVTNAFVEAEASKSEFNTANVVDEDRILKEAKDIEAKRKRITELSMIIAPVEPRRKSHWDYVLEEMAWLANDFAQERIWKISAAAQICHQVAFACRKKKQEQVPAMAVKKVAHTMAQAVMEFWHLVEEKRKEFEHQSQKNAIVSVQAYAMRFLKYNDSSVVLDQLQMPLTPDTISDMGTNDLSWKDNLTEENLFYSIPPGAMEAYRNSIESHVDMCERNGGVAQEEVDTSPFDNVAGYDSQYNAFDDEEGETSTYDKPSRFGQKKQKHALFTQQPSFLVKRPGSSLNVSIPTKRVRTASRRVISPYGVGTSGHVQFPSKTDVSSGDTDSFQDDQSTPFDAESVGDFENQLPFDSAEVSTKPKKKKKKKAKNLSVAHEQRWQTTSGLQHEQKDHFKRRTENHQVESNYSTGQPAIKKPKIMRQAHDNFFNNVTPASGSVPSPVASQMSNMNKLLNGTRDRGRKPKGHKVPAGQPGSGSGWSKFEEQALVVLVHDLGPNWELVSDAFNSTFHFKCVFRNAQECKERHKTLVDSSADGADSADDSGSSQHYPSTLPGIPKGSARQLFQRLQGPIEEETLKSHFDKLQALMEKRPCRKAPDRVPFQTPHSSHTVALSQVCPNNLNGGPILTPIDLCAATVAGQDIPSLGYQGPPSSGVAVPSQTPLSPSPALQGSQNMMIGNNVSSSPGPLGSSSRDGRYGVPRPASLSTDEQQQRMQQYNYRNVAQSSNISSPGAHPGIERARIVPSNNGMGMAVNRSMSMVRPGFASSSIVNSGSMVAPATAINSGPALGNSIPRPGNNQNTPHFGGLSSGTSSSPVPSYTVHHQPPSHPLSPQHPQLLSPRHPHFQGPPNHVPGSHQQAYANRLAKERQLQQQRLISQKQSSSLIPPSAPMQNTTQGHVSSPSSSMNSIAQQKHPGPNQSGNQRPKQQLSQSNRQHPLQRQLSQGKVAKGVTTKNQSIPMDPAQLNGVSASPTANQCSDKGEPANSVPQATQPKRRYMPSQSPNLNLTQQNSQAVAPPGVSVGHHQKLLNTSAQSSVPPDRQINGEQHPTNSSAEMDKESTLPQSTSAVAIVYPAAINQSQSSDPLLGSNELVSAANLSSFVPTPPDLSGSMPRVGQGPNLHSHQKAQLLQAGSRPSNPELE